MNPSSFFVSSRTTSGRIVGVLRHPVVIQRHVLASLNGG